MDLNGVTSCDSTAIGLMMKLRRRVKHANGDASVTLRNPTPDVLDVFVASSLVHRPEPEASRSDTGVFTVEFTAAEATTEGDEDLSPAAAQLAARLESAPDSAGRQAIFLESMLAAAPEERDGLLRVALDRSETQQETMERAAVAGTFAEGVEEKLQVFATTSDCQPDHVESEMSASKVTHTSSQFKLFLFGERLKRTYSGVRMEAKAAQARRR